MNMLKHLFCERFSVVDLVTASFVFQLISDSKYITALLLVVISVSIIASIKKAMYI